MVSHLDRWRGYPRVVVTVKASSGMETHARHNVHRLTARDTAYGTALTYFFQALIPPGPDLYVPHTTRKVAPTCCMLGDG